MAKKEKNTITVNEVEYNLDDLTPRQSTLLNHVNDLDRKLGNAQFNLDQLMVGREAFIVRLATSLEAPEEDAEEIAAE